MITIRSLAAKEPASSIAQDMPSCMIVGSRGVLSIAEGLKDATFTHWTTVWKLLHARRRS